MAAAHTLETTPLIPLLLRRPELFRLTSPAIHPHQNTPPYPSVNTPPTHISRQHSTFLLSNPSVHTFARTRERESKLLRSRIRPPLLGGATIPESSKKQRTPATRELRLSEGDGSDD
ncbi:hypothetical protein Hdeb2414_s1271g01001861 [Helianthus debilis subsp. tardiflorus]